MASMGPPLPEAARQALEQGEKLQAIRLMREITGAGLKEAKEAVESHLAAHPHLQDRFPPVTRVTGTGCLLVLLGLAGIAAAAWFFTSKQARRMGQAPSRRGGSEVWWAQEVPKGGRLLPPTVPGIIWINS